MTLTDYLLQVLVEENPYTECLTIADRPITYEDAAVSIALDIQERTKGEKIDDIVNYWLKVEFGHELNPIAVERVIIRIKHMTSEELLREGFNT